jgi:heme o synthase
LHTFSIRSFLTLIRVTLSLAVTFSAFAAFIAGGGKIDRICLTAMSAIFFFAAGTSVLNQIQERKIDSLMDRTKNRPIPAGELSPTEAMAISIFFILAGIVFFVTGKLWVPLYLGIANIILYNGIYSRMKMKTTFALIPGAVTGAIPIFMGWSAAGGNILEPVPLFLGLFMFFWQMPHFWLLMLAHDEEYKNAGIPKMTDSFSTFQVKRMILVWLVAASITSLFMVVRGFSHHFLMAVVILFLNILLLILTIYKFFIVKSDSFRLLFILVNCFLFIVLALLIVEKYIYR